MLRITVQGGKQSQLCTVVNGVSYVTLTIVVLYVVAMHGSNGSDIP